MIEIQFVGSLYGAGPNIRPGCVASIRVDEPFIFRSDRAAHNSTHGLMEAYARWCETPVSEGNTTYPRRYVLSPVAVLRDLCAQKEKRISIGQEIYFQEHQAEILKKIERAIANSDEWEVA